MCNNCWVLFGFIIFSQQFLKFLVFGWKLKMFEMLIYCIQYTKITATLCLSFLTVIILDKVKHWDRFDLWHRTQSLLSLLSLLLTLAVSPSILVLNGYQHISTLGNWKYFVRCMLVLLQSYFCIIIMHSLGSIIGWLWLISPVKEIFPLQCNGLMSNNAGHPVFQYVTMMSHSLQCISMRNKKWHKTFDQMFN